MSKKDRKSRTLSEKFETTMSDMPKDVRLSPAQVDALIDQLREIAKANIDLIEQAEAMQMESEISRKRSSQLQWLVSIAFILGSFLAIGTYVNVTAATDEMNAEIVESQKSFDALDMNVRLTLSAVRAISDAHAAKIKADIDMDADADAIAKRAANDAQKKIAEAEVEIQKDPAKKAKAEKRLKQIEDDARDY